MRRKHGSGLTRHEQSVLAAALRLHREGSRRLYGYELFASMAAWAGNDPMNHGTLYRCLRAVELRGLFTSTVEDVGPRPRVFYELTGEGFAVAQQSVIQLLASDHPPTWLDVGLAAHPGGTT